MNIEKIRALWAEPIVQTYDTRDVMLYALGVGYGSDPCNEVELQFVYERSLTCLPCYANVLCHPGFWVQDPELGIDAVKVLHAEQDLVVHQPLPPAATISGQCAVIGIEDKGAGRGALLHQQTDLYDAETGDHYATVRATLFLRGNGGQGGFGERIEPAQQVPDRAPDHIVDIPTLPRQALIFRLSGDWNPLHVDPAVATQAGFAKPILHGLCAKGIADRAILATFCDNDASRLRSLSLRFSKPLMPGETIRLEFFEEPAGLIRFRALAAERGEIVLDRGRAVIA